MLETENEDCEYCKNTGTFLISVTDQFGEDCGTKEVKCNLCTRENADDDFIDDDSK